MNVSDTDLKKKNLKNDAVFLSDSDRIDLIVGLLIEIVCEDQ